MLQALWQLGGSGVGVCGSDAGIDMENVAVGMEVVAVETMAVTVDMKGGAVGMMTVAIDTMTVSVDPSSRGTDTALPTDLGPFVSTKVQGASNEGFGITGWNHRIDIIVARNPIQRALV